MTEAAAPMDRICGPLQNNAIRTIDFGLDEPTDIKSIAECPRTAVRNPFWAPRRTPKELHTHAHTRTEHNEMGSRNRL